MPTDDERREVAWRLRMVDVDSIGHGYELLEEVADCIDDEGVKYGAYERFAVLLADLIEPEPERTCEDVSTEHGKFECSYCGCKITDTRCVDNGLVRFCPDCGRWVENAY